MTTDPITADPDLRVVLRDIFDRDLHDRLDQSTGITHDVALWEQLSELGFTALTAPEEHGGSGAGWLEAAALLGESAAAARHLPLAESDLLAHWLLRKGGLPPSDPTTAHTVAIVEPDGTSLGAPWLDRLPVVVATRRQDGTLAIADLTADEVAEHATITPVPTLSGQPRGDLTFATEVPAETVLDADTAAILLDQFALRGALARAVQVVAALEKAVDLCVEHCSVRVQFGRPLAKFQAVQQLVADASAEAALARAAVDAAVLDAAATDLVGPTSATRVAAARSCVGHATSVVVRNAHQVHGAIGTTQEHPLQLFTHAALDWRGEFGTTRSWDRVLGEVVRSHPTALWNAVIGEPIPDTPAVQPRLGRSR